MGGRDTAEVRDEGPAPSIAMRAAVRSAGGGGDCAGEVIRGETMAGARGDGRAALRAGSSCCDELPKKREVVSSDCAGLPKERANRLPPAASRVGVDSGSTCCCCRVFGNR